MQPCTKEGQGEDGEKLFPGEAELMDLDNQVSVGMQKKEPLGMTLGLVMD
jgi:hypothetical protein